MNPIYQQIHDKIRKAVDGKIRNQFLARPLEGTIQNFNSAQLAYGQLYQEYLNNFDKIAYLLNILMRLPTPVSSIILSCLCQPFLSEELRAFALLSTRQITVHLQKENAFTNAVYEARKELPLNELIDDDENKNNVILAAQLLMKDNPILTGKLQDIMAAQSLLLGLENNVFDCAAISTWVIFELMSNGIEANRIERILIPHDKDPTAKNAHIYVVIDRKKGSDPKKISTWDADIICPWYGYCGSTNDICNIEGLKNYFLLHDLSNKIPTTPDYSPALLASYIGKANQLLPADIQILMPKFKTG